MNTIKGKPMSRTRAAGWAAVFVVMAGLSAFTAVSAAVDRSMSAPLIVPQSFLSVWFLGMAWMFFAHRQFNVPRMCEGPEGSA